jgi:hypothetical protein
MNKNDVQRFIDEWNDSIQIVYSITEEILRIIQMIDIEIERSKNKNENEFLLEIQPWFRIAIRSAIATIEAICYIFKQVTILVCDLRKKPLTLAEREKLLEKKQDKDGKFQTYYLKTKENIKFTLKKVYYAFDLPFEIKDHEGWKKLSNTIDIRHKVTHPKKKNDLDISPQIYRDAVEGFNWFGNKMKQLDKLFSLKFGPTGSQKH